ncbi:MAG: type 1 glutamine amidotransferase [Pseudomonadota bacterium]
MPRILVADGNTPELNARREADNRGSVGLNYASALKYFAPEIEIEVARPYYPGWQLDRIDFDAFDGLAVTGSSVDWCAADILAKPFWELYEKAFAAGTPVIGCCWGLQNGAVVLGGDSDAGPNGFELGFARQVSLTEAGKNHPFHKGRSPVFDVLCVHRDDVTRLPKGAEITATNAHTTVQGMIYEQGGVDFWGVQYHPEMTLSDLTYILRKRDVTWNGERANALSLADDLETIVADPDTSQSLRQTHDVDGDLIDFDRHGVELRNWLDVKILSQPDSGKKRNLAAV